MSVCSEQHYLVDGKCSLCDPLRATLNGSNCYCDPSKGAIGDNAESCKCNSSYFSFNGSCVAQCGSRMFDGNRTCVSKCELPYGLIRQNDGYLCAFCPEGQIPWRNQTCVEMKKCANVVQNGNYYICDEVKPKVNITTIDIVTGEPEETQNAPPSFTKQATLVSAGNKTVAYLLSNGSILITSNTTSKQTLVPGNYTDLTSGPGFFSARSADGKLC